MTSAFAIGESKKDYFLVFFCIFIPLTYYILVTFIFPRPYYIQPADIEQDYYYGAKLVHDGFPPFGISHPGTPIYELGGLILRITGDQINQTQTFFNVAYLAIGIVNAIGLIVLSRMIRQKAGLGFSLLSILLSVSLPGWLSYSHTFGADSFLTPVILILISCFWISLDLSLERRIFVWVIVGIIGGLCLSVKLSTLPIWGAILLASILFAWLNRHNIGTKRSMGILQFIIIPIFSVISFLLFTSPTFARLPQIFINLSQRHEIYPTLSPWALLRNLSPLKFAPYFYTLYVITGIAALITLLIFVRLILSQIKTKRFSEKKVLTKGFLLFIIIASLGYSILSTSPIENINQSVLFDTGIFLRNAIPSSLFLPFAIIYIFEEYQGRLKGRMIKFVNWVLISIGAIIVFLTWKGYLAQRNEFIQYVENSTSITETALKNYLLPGTRVAEWDGSPGNLLGEASFHFWGNYDYARELYDKELLAYFKDFTFLKLREVNRLLTREGDSVTSTGYLGLWKQLFPSPYYFPHNNELVSGEYQGEQVSVIAFPSTELENEKVSLNDLYLLIKERFGDYTLVEKQIGNVEWEIIILLSLKQ